jgi:hypothetical protein
VTLKEKNKSLDEQVNVADVSFKERIKQLEKRMALVSGNWGPHQAQLSLAPEGEPPAGGS